MNNLLSYDTLCVIYHDCTDYANITTTTTAEPTTIAPNKKSPSNWIVGFSIGFISIVIIALIFVIRKYRPSNENNERISLIQLRLIEN